jgi:hypothetical protein
MACVRYVDFQIRLQLKQRQIFLQLRPHVSIMQAEWLLGWSRRKMSEAIENGEVELWTTPLGNDADGILPQAIRSAELSVRLPRHHIDMLEYWA